MAKKASESKSYIQGVDEYISRIRSKYSVLSESERLVADYFLANAGGNSFELNIREISEATNTSPATVIRFCKVLGFKGFAEFKFSVQNGILAPIGGNIQIGNNDDMPTLKQKIVEFAKQNFMSTIMQVDNEQLEKAIDAIMACRQIVVCGVGTSSGVAQSVANTFMIMGKPCLYIPEALTMLRTVSLLDDRDLVLGITTCGYVKNVIDMLVVAREHNVPTICVTGISDSMVTKYADIVLKCMLKDDSNPLDVLSVAMCQIATLQLLQMGYLTRSGDQIAKKIKEKFYISELTRYCVDMDEVSLGRVRSDK